VQSLPMAQSENKSKGILWMLATMVCFIALDATTKYAMQIYPLFEVTWGRFFFSTIMALLLAGRDLTGLIRTTPPGLQTLRSLMLMATTMLFNAGIVSVSLPMGTTIMYLSPIIVTMLSALVLGEHVGWRRWTSIGIGFIGALITIGIWQTGSSGINRGAALLLCAAATNAIYQIFTRKLRGDNPYSTLIYTAMAGTVVTSFLAPLTWQTPDVFGWALLIGAGVLGCLGHLCLIRAFTAAPASVVAPFSYSSLIWATIAGFAIWGDWPSTTTLLGAALIIGSGLYIFLRERKLAAKAAT
jgi:drug/metabolite transporter (DMT)-like permease